MFRFALKLQFAMINDIYLLLHHALYTYSICAVYRTDLSFLFDIDLIYMSLKQKQFAPDSIEL